MATASAPLPVPMTPRSETVVYPESQAETGTGWLFFAGTIMGLMGLMRIVDSMWAFRYNGTLPTQLKDALFGSNLTTYAWVWLAVGVVLLCSSFMVLVRSQFARWFGILAVSVAALVALTWMPYYPVWALTYVALAALTLFALIVHGARTETT